MKATIFVRAAIITCVLLLIPFIAMQLSAEVNWSVSDFIIGGIIIFTASLAFSFALRGRGNTAYRAAAYIAIGTAFLHVWSNLAVGALGSGPNFANLMYGAMIILGITGAALARFRANGMARILFAMAITQALVPTVAWIIFELKGMPGKRFEDIGAVIGFTGFFAGLWLLSAVLFRRAGTTAPIKPQA